MTIAEGTLGLAENVGGHEDSYEIMGPPQNVDGWFG